VKIGLVSVALAWGGTHKLIAVPAVARGSTGLFAKLQRSLIGESMVGMAVLLAAAILVDAKPPPQPAPTQPAATSVPR
jgi:putative copper export protein